MYYLFIFLELLLYAILLGDNIFIFIFLNVIYF